MTAAKGHLRSKPATGRRYLIVVRAGDNSLHRNWLAGEGGRGFDLLVSYYGDQPERYAADGEHFHHVKGSRWPAHHVIQRDNPALMASYDHVCFACDDLEADLATWNRLFAFCSHRGLDLAQPAILGPISFEITAPQPRLLYRDTTFVEVMCPVFSRRALAVCRTTFGESVSGWGLDMVWPRLLADRGWGLAIIDSICVTHTRAMGEGTLYYLLDGMGVDPRAELESLLVRFAVSAPPLEDVGRHYPSPGVAMVDRTIRAARRFVVEPVRKVAGRVRRLVLRPVGA